MSRQYCSVFWEELYQSATFAPASASPFAISWPMPPEPPVIIAVFPARENICITESERWGVGSGRDVSAGIMMIVVQVWYFAMPWYSIFVCKEVERDGMMSLTRTMKKGH